MVVLTALGMSLIAAAQEPAAAPPPPPTQVMTYELGGGGLIRNWLTLGYLPGIPAAEVDRLAGVGGETNAQPYGGQTVTFPPAAGSTQALALVWQWAEARPPEIPWSMISTPGVYLFVDKGGKAVENAVGYLYCGLDSAEAQRLQIRFCGGEPIRVWFNGEVVPIEGRRGWRCEWDMKPGTLNFKKGMNRLLVRLENRTEDEFLFARLSTETGGAVTNVKVSLKEAEKTPMLSKRLLAQDWNKVVAEIPPVPPSADEDLFGANLSRTLTLLETGGQTKRPVRILFYGQSITCQEWVWMLVRRLRERYPNTEIQAENWAISGWVINRLQRVIRRDILTKRPDLIVMHAYTGGSWEWERIIQNIRRETSAEIMIRSAHISKGDEDRNALWEDDSEALILRRLARTYGCEYVEGRKEWLQYMRTHTMPGQELRSDGIHLSRKGCVLMAQLYERHFRRHSAGRPWFDTVRRYEAMRPLADRRNDEVRLIGGGWDDRQVNCVMSTGSNDSLRLRFNGTRVDVIMPPHNGEARVFIDGRPPTQWNLFTSGGSWRRGKTPAELMTYFLGTNMVAESWSLDFTHVSGDHNRFRYKLTGSVTGPDGEGDNTRLFVSNSGRITINPDDFLVDGNGAVKGETNLVAVTGEAGLRWSVSPAYGDVVRGVPLRRGEAGGERYTVPYRYATIVDGLPPGDHELTLEPLPPKPGVWAFSIEAVEVHCPPLRP
jgi:hypothetical protein